MIDLFSGIQSVTLLIFDLTYVDDNYIDGEEAEVTWATDTINERFDCKDLDWVTRDAYGVPIDYLGTCML